MVFPLIGAALSMGLPYLVNLVSEALGKVDNPAAKAAADALTAVGSEIANGSITPEQMAEANRHVEAMAKIEADRDTSQLQTINDTMQTEAKSDDKYVARWRPTFGYIVSGAWAVQILAISYLIVSNPTLAVPVLQALDNGTSTMWFIALSILGVSVYTRSREKLQGLIGNTQDGVANPSLLQRILGR